MAKIAVDIDNTLYSFDNECREAFFEMAIEKKDKSYLKGAYTPQVEWRSLADILGWEALAEAIEIVHDKTLDQEPYKGAVRVVNELSEAGHEIRYISTRKEKHGPNTVAWLTHNMFPVGDVICCGTDKSKHLQDCQYLIDDRPKTILDFIYDYDWLRNNFGGLLPGTQRLAFGLWFPYNQALTDVDNIYLAPAWRGIRYYLEKKRVL